MRTVRTASTLKPASCAAPTVLAATGSITPGLGSTLISVVCSPGRLVQHILAHDRDHRSLGHRVTKQRAGESHRFVASEFALHQKAAGEGDRNLLSETKLRDLFAGANRLAIHLIVGWIDVDLPKRHGKKAFTTGSAV